jgi:hypothetical protein
MPRRFKLQRVARFAAIIAATATALLAAPTAFAQPLPGAIWTTDNTCVVVNGNIYADQDSVYISGGPDKAGALPDGSYYVQVTAPDGALLGTSIGAGTDKPLVISGGVPASCYQLSSILIKASDGTPGYDLTSNAGGEYKVWVSTVSTFANNSSKTDNFKVRGPGCDDSCVALGRLTVDKFYDADADGVWDTTEPAIAGWQFTLTGFTGYLYTSWSSSLDPGSYTAQESNPVQSNWLHTTPTSVTQSVTAGNTSSITFGNVCTGGGGGLTLGFWSNNNGRALFGSDDLALMASLNLRSANGSNFDPANYNAFRTWLLAATATNMAYMLSAQLAAMELNVLNGKVNSAALVYAPGTTSANSLGFANVNALMSEANASLGASGYTVASGPTRMYQEALKTALDKANNNLTFVQGSPCTFSFASS